MGRFGLVGGFLDQIEEGLGGGEGWGGGGGEGEGWE